MKRLGVIIFLLMVGGPLSWAGSAKDIALVKANESQRVYLIAFGSPKDAEKIQRYKKAAGAVLKKYGARFPAKHFNVNEVVKGNSNPSFLNSVEFPNKESILSALSDPEYLNVTNDRDAGFKDLNILILTH